MKKVESDLKKLEQKILSHIKKIGIIEAAKLAGGTKGYYSQLSTGHRKMSAKKIFELSEKFKI